MQIAHLPDFLDLLTSSRASGESTATTVRSASSKSDSLLTSHSHATREISLPWNSASSPHSEPTFDLPTSDGLKFW